MLYNRKTNKLKQKVNDIMREVIGFLILIGLIIVLWSGAYVFYSQGDMTGTYVTFGFGAFFAVLFIYSIHYYMNLKRRDEFVHQDYETIMTHFHHVENTGNDWYIIHTIWLDPEGNQYFFKSDMIKYNPEMVLRDKLVPVKVSLLNRTYYTMDLSSLPKLA